jgi:hypothetical protein
MTLLERLQTHHTGRQFIDEFDPLEVDLKVGESPDFVAQIHAAPKTEYVAELRIGTSFRANPADFARGKADAQRLLIAALYEDVNRELPVLRLAISSGDRRAAMQALHRIEKVTHP